ncbi:hypothetical protein AVEN_88081-1 [Araneus ventricosus]|uniref:Uncharacterized protein n=1 Tax=Araneus ventricosus TaxID=182803 RepID=A0A4Y2R2B5_ARAVE|nr:hypothetical protein AVEN_88081-1 [Araneus ventricosus]
MGPGIVMQEDDTITQHARASASLASIRLSKWHKRDNFSERHVISISLTDLRTYTTYLHIHCKTTCTICVQSGEKYSLQSYYFSNSAASNLHLYPVESLDICKPSMVT